jgi:hypothetical protein
VADVETEPGSNADGYPMTVCLLSFMTGKTKEILAVEKGLGFNFDHTEEVWIKI